MPLGLYLKKLLPYPRSSRFSMLSSRSFIVLCFTLRSHFELIFMKDVKSVSRFLFFFFNGYSVFLALFVEMAIFAPLYCLCCFAKDELAVFM